MISVKDAKYHFHTLYTYKFSKNIVNYITYVPLIRPVIRRNPFCKIVVKVCTVKFMHAFVLQVL